MHITVLNSTLGGYRTSYLIKFNAVTRKFKTPSACAIGGAIVPAFHFSINFPSLDFRQGTVTHRPVVTI